jgi:hypothetical protein
MSTIMSKSEKKDPRARWNRAEGRVDSAVANPNNLRLTD